MSIAYYPIKTFCSGCRFLTEAAPETRRGGGQCAKFMVLVNEKGAGLYERAHLRGDALEQAVPFYPNSLGGTSFGCTAFEPGEGAEMAELPTPEALEDLKRRLLTWAAKYPEQFEALQSGERWEQHQVMERLRFADGRLFLGLSPLAPTSQALRAYMDNLTLANGV